jgi:monofunctional biosynthetic peptidoglycan transglycosylase
MKKGQKQKLIKLALIFTGLVIVFSPLYMYFSENVSRLQDEYPHIRLSESKLEADYEISPKRPSGWVPLNQISKYAKWSIIFSEDWSFYDHEGIDVEQIKTALSQMVEEKKFRGASTITQQMVKNVYLSESRTVTRKIHEIILAQKVEKILTKNRILEVYLNVIEYGPGIFGINEASKHYFRKTPSALTPREGAFLAMLLPSPKKYYTSFKKKCLTEFARSRIRNILKKLKMGKVINGTQYEKEISARYSWEKC